VHVQRVVMPASPVESWTVVGEDGAAVEPAERYLAYLTAIERSSNMTHVVTQEPAKLACCRNIRRFSRAVYRMGCSQRECFPRPRPLRRSLPFRADSLLDQIHAPLGLIGGDQLAGLGITSHAFTVGGSTAPSGAH
jgi:hypothetical protein